MTAGFGGDRQRALAALHEARPAIGRMDLSRGPESTAADIVAGWHAVEAALRALVNAPSLTGQSLIREARQRQLLAFDQANSLAEFEAAYDRASVAGYRPTDGDVNSARTAFLKLETVLMHEGPGTGSPESGRPAPVPPASAPAAAPIMEPLADNIDLRPRGRRWLVPVLVTVVIAAVAIGGFFAYRAKGESNSVDEGIRAYQAGQREAAVAAFTRAAREDPKDATPHIYLGRMAREVGNMTLANQELQLAIETEPNNPVGHREMGSYLLAAKNYELARKFYVRAVQIDSTDRVALGWLGCTLARLNRVEEAQKFIQHAGQGDWTRCLPAPGTLPPR
jgi:tetratricopeptide (TPR) repeat protein